ncbi:MAG: hypothetical protein R3F19_28725 [Verrucomicrobiales bacterium]
MLHRSEQIRVANRDFHGFFHEFVQIAVDLSFEEQRLGAEDGGIFGILLR